MQYTMNVSSFGFRGFGIAISISRWYCELTMSLTGDDNSKPLDKSKRLRVGKNVKEQVKIAYLTTRLTNRQLADKYSIPFGTICSWVARGKWNEERDSVHQETANRAIAIQQSIVEDSVSNLQKRYLERVQTQVNRGLNAIEQSSMVSVSEVDTTFNALNKVHSVAKSVYGLEGQQNRTDNRPIINVAFLASTPNLKSDTISNPPKQAIDIPFNPVKDRLNEGVVQ